MEKFYAGLLVGFFLAFAMVFGFVQASLAPHYNEIKEIKPDVDMAYKATHSEKYSDVRALIVNVKSASESLAALPVIGGGIDALGVQNYAQQAIDLMDNAKGISEGMVPLVDTALGAIEVSAWAFWVSLVLVLAGVYSAFGGCKAFGKKAPAAKKAKKGKR
jgi:hypothetical protein